MGLSFKVSKTGTRFRPRPRFGAFRDDDPAPSDGSVESPHAPNGAGSKREVNVSEGANYVTSSIIPSSWPKELILPEHEVSFTLNLFQKGYFIGKPSETENFQPMLQDMKSLHPYDRASESLFSAIESGWLPGDILDDIPSKYFRGTVVCEVHDYRKCTSEQGTAGSALDAGPTVNKVLLRMSLENIVKDMPLISDDSWTYSDLMEVESRILKSLQPKLCLDPTPMLDRLCDDPSSSKLDLGIGRKRRLRQTAEVIVTSNNQSHGKKVCIDRLPEHFKAELGTVQGDSRLQRVNENAIAQHLPGGISSMRSNNFAQEMARPALPLSSQSKFQPSINHPGVLQDHGSPANFTGANTNVTSPLSSYSDSLLGKREIHDSQLTPISGTKRSKQNTMGVDGIQQQPAGPQFIGLNGVDMQWKNPLLHQQLEVKGIQYSSALSGQRYPSQVMNNISNQETGGSFYFNQQGMRYGPKEEQTEMKLERQELEKSKDARQASATENNMPDQHQLRTQHLPQQQPVRNHLPPLTQWHNPRTLVEKDSRKDDMLQKRKPMNSPRVSSGPMVQSPVSSKSGEISSGSVGGQFSVVATSALGSQKDKVAATSNAALGAPSVTSSPNDSMQRQHQTSVGAKRKSNSVPKTQTMSGVGSPASVSNINAPLNANSPSIGTASMGDQAILDHFSKIDMLTQRYQLNVKKNKVDDYHIRKPVSYSSQLVSACLSDSFNAEDFVDPIQPLSKSVIGGTTNAYKTRVLNFMRTEHGGYQGYSSKSQNQLTLHEKSGDDTVTLQYGDTSDASFSNGCSLSLPTNNYADLLASQFSSLMEREGYQKIEDQTQRSRLPVGVASGSTAAIMGIPPDNAATHEMKPAEMVPGQPSNLAALASNNGMGPLSSSQNLSNGARLLSAGNNSQPLSMSQGYLPGSPMIQRPQQIDQPLLQQQQQQQQQQLLLQQNQQSQIQQQQLPISSMQRPPGLLSTNPLSQMVGQNSNLQMAANHIVNNKSPLQLQMLHQQAQAQQKVMMGLNAINRGNIGNNMVALGNLSNVMGMAGVRGISSPMGIPSLGNINPNQMNLGTASNFGTGRPGPMSMATMVKWRSATQKAMYNPQSGIVGIPGSSNQMLPNSSGLSMLGHALNRGNMSPLQRNAMASMGPPKVSGTNFYLNSQLQLHVQQQQQQQLQQQQQQQVQQQQQAQQQQQISSPLQQAQVGSPQVVGSPPAMVMQQQQISPQQIGQQTVMSPQQLSSGALQQITSNAGPGPGPASPQLSSQTHGSVGSITSSPMEQLQGANKGGSAGNV